MRDTFPDPPSHERSWAIHLASPATAATRRYYLGRTRGGLFVLRNILLFSEAVAVSAVAFHTFRPFVLHPGQGVHYIATPRATSTYAIAADDGFRIHDEESLDYHMTRGMALGVEVVTTSTPASVRWTFDAALDYAG
jgi:hypothetical protein